MNSGNVGAGAYYNVYKNTNAWVNPGPPPPLSTTPKIKAPVLPASIKRKPVINP